MEVHVMSKVMRVGCIPLRAKEGWSMRATLSIRVGSSAIRLTLLSKGPAECSATSACTPSQMFTLLCNPIPPPPPSPQRRMCLFSSPVYMPKKALLPLIIGAEILRATMLQEMYIHQQCTRAKMKQAMDFNECRASMERSNQQTSLLLLYTYIPYSLGN